MEPLSVRKLTRNRASSPKSSKPREILKKTSKQKRFHSANFYDRHVLAEWSNDTKKVLRKKIIYRGETKTHSQNADN
jgi:hypothetical protein